MSQGKLHLRSITTINKVRKSGIAKSILLLALLALSIPFASKAQTAPGFQNPSPQVYSGLICMDAAPVDISTYLDIFDPEVGETETWSQVTAPLHGTLVGFPATATSIGSSLSIGPGLTYQPATGYTGIDSFTIMVDDGTGLSDVTTIIVNITGAPILGPIYGAAFSVCIGSTITLQEDTAGGVWTKSNGNISISGATTLSVTGVAVGTTNITYTSVGACGTTTVTTNVTVTLLPVVGPTFGIDTVCPGAVITLFNSTAGGVWSASNSNAVVNPATGDVTGVSTGLDTIFYSVTLPCGTSVVPFYIRVLSLPIPATLSGPSSVCVGTNITLTPTISGGLWFRQNATAGVTGAGVVSGLIQGVDTIIYSIYNACGSATASHVVTVNPQPFAGIITGPASSVCVGNTLTLSVSASGGSWLATNTHASVSGGVVTGASGGVDTIEYSVTNVCNTAISTYVVTVIPTPSAGTITGPTSVCVNDSVILLNPTATGAGTWAVLNPRATINSAGKAFGITAGLDTVRFVYTNVCGSDTTKRAITINPLPFAGGITGPTKVCVNYTVALADTIAGGVWSTLSTKASVSSSGVVTGINAGIATITYTYTNMCGSVFVTHKDTVLALPDSGVITGPNKVCVGASITLNDTATGGVWSSGSGSLATVAGGTGVVTGVAGGVVQISYSKTNSCRTSVVTHTVTVNTVPNAGTIIGDTVICKNILLQFATTTPDGTWSTTNGNVFVDADGGYAGVYPNTMDTIIYTVTNECGSTKAYFYIRVEDDDICWRTAVPQLNGADMMCKVYPNPATEELIIKIESGSFKSFTITNQIGQVVLQQDLKNIQTEVNIQSLATGIYNITLYGENGMITKRLIKQ